MLSPRPIVDAVLQLEELLNKLEQVVTNIIKDIDNKKLVGKILIFVQVHFLFLYILQAYNKITT